MIFKKAILTDVGRALLARAHAGEKITWTNVGVTYVLLDEAEIPGMSSSVVQLSATSLNAVVANDVCTLSASFSNSELTNGMFARTCCIFAKIGNEEPVLVAAAVQDGSSIYLNEGAIGVFHFTIDFGFKLSNASSVTVEINTSGFASSAALQATNAAVQATNAAVHELEQNRLRIYPSLLHAAAKAKEGEIFAVSPLNKYFSVSSNTLCGKEITNNFAYDHRCYFNNGSLFVHVVYEGGNSPKAICGLASFSKWVNGDFSLDSTLYDGVSDESPFKDLRGFFTLEVQGGGREAFLLGADYRLYRIANNTWYTPSTAPAFVNCGAGGVSICNLVSASTYSWECVNGVVLDTNSYTFETTVLKADLKTNSDPSLNSGIAYGLPCYTAVEESVTGGVISLLALKNGGVFSSSNSHNLDFIGFANAAVVNVQNVGISEFSLSGGSLNLLGQPLANSTLFMESDCKGMFSDSHYNSVRFSGAIYPITIPSGFQNILFINVGCRKFLIAIDTYNEHKAILYSESGGECYDKMLCRNGLLWPFLSR